MALKGLKCDKHGTISFDEIASGKCDCYPRFLLHSVAEISKKDYHTGNIITPTTLIGCLRETYLSRITDYYSPIESLYYSWRGTLIHKIMERKDLEGWMSEKVYSKTVEITPARVFTITGQIDGYDSFTQTLWDIKTIGDNGIGYVVKDGAKEDHIPQVNIYKWLLPLEVKRIRLLYITMMTFAQTGQINSLTKSLKTYPTKKKYGFSYMQTPTREEISPSGYAPFKMFYDTPEVQIWTEEQVLDYIVPRADIMIDAFEKKIMPPMCDEKTQAWKCDKYCNFKEQCDKYEEKQCQEKT